MILKRAVHAQTGIFGQLLSDAGERIGFSLEHAYLDTSRPWDDAWIPKLPKGEYVCTRGQHTVGKLGAIETFEVTNVPGHTGILFHVGNFNTDSEGCILLGTDIDNDQLENSLKAFLRFMDELNGIDSFNLKVI